MKIMIANKDVASKRPGELRAACDILQQHKCHMRCTPGIRTEEIQKTETIINQF
uniref:Uncharacterized protein n=1 Tax=Arion vulgaris TaxID=1028688 RepID=A0A0B6Z568_9EUPU